MRLLTGVEDADLREITNVNIMDNPDTYDWLSAGDFLLTTGYLFRDSPEMQIQLIRELSELNCAGLGIKEKRYLSEIPPSMLEEANKHRFPIVQIPFHYTLAQVSNTINNEIFNRKDTMLQKSMRIHDDITQCILSGGDVQTIAQKVCELTGNPSLIVDSNWGLLAFAEHPGNPFPLSEHLELRFQGVPFKKEFLRELPGHMEEMTKGIKRSYPGSGQKIPCRILPVTDGKNVYGYLIAWETVSKIGQIDLVAMQSAATAIALERIKTRQIEESRYHMRQDFFDDLLQGRLHSVNATRHLAELYNIDPQKPHVCMIAKLRPQKGVDEESLENREAFSRRKNQLSEFVGQVLTLHKRSQVTFHRHNLVISLIALKPEEVFLRMGGVLREEAVETLEMLRRECPDGSPLIGVGKPCANLVELKRSYVEAQEAIRVSQNVNPDGQVCFFDDFSVYHLLSSAVREDVLEEFCAEALGALMKSDRENGTEFIRTLEAYFNCNANSSLAAKRLFIHRNTFLYRIEKLKVLLHTELDNPEELLQLQLALHIAKIIHRFS